MRKRLAKVEQTVAALQQENAVLRAELAELRALIGARGDSPGASAPGGKVRGRYAVLLLTLTLVLLPVLLYMGGRLNTFWSTTLGAVNGFLLYMVGPSAYHLLFEGLIRAIPGVLLGHSTRIAIDKVRNRRRTKAKLPTAPGS